MLELNQNDINALLNTLVASQSAGAGALEQRVTEVKIYDFTQAESLPGDFLRVLDNINHQFTRALSDMLTMLLSTVVQVELLSVEQMTYRQYCHQIPEVTVISAFTLTPLEGMALLELNPLLVAYLLDRSMGGSGEVQASSREFSPIEKGLLEELIRRMLRDLAKAWEPLVPLQLTLRDMGSNPTIVRVAQPDDRMVVSSFGVTVQDISALCTYCLPVSSLDFEWLLDPEKSWNDDVKQVAAREHQKLLETFATVPITVRACMRDIEISLGELATLREGDIISLNGRATDPIEIRVENRRCLQGRPITLGTTLAVEVLEEAAHDLRGDTGEGKQEASPLFGAIPSGMSRAEMPGMDSVWPDTTD